MACVVRECKSHSSRMKNETEVISFHRFPEDNTMKQIWMETISRQNCALKTNRRICSKHFKDNCFINKDSKWRRLKASAVPSLHLYEDSFTSIESYIPTEVDHNGLSTSNQGQKQCLKCENLALRTRINQLELNLEKHKAVSKRRLLKIKALRQKERRLKKKNNDFIEPRYDGIVKDRENFK